MLARGAKLKISNKTTEDVITEIAGQDVLVLVRYLKDKKNVSEFKLAEITKQEVNTVRNMLYRLYHANLVTFVKKKDKQKGWYIYYWTFNGKHIKHLMEDLKRKKLEKLKDRLEREKSTQFYVCENKCMRLEFEQAAGYEYKCPECGDLMFQEDNAEKIKQIEEEIKGLNTEA